MSEKLIKLVGLSKFYSTNGVVALGLRNISLELGLGEFVVITGASGSGKTTLLNVIAGMDTFQEGKFIFNGEDTSYYDQSEYARYRRENVCFVFQNYNLVESFTVFQNVELALVVKGGRRKDTVAEIDKIIDRVGLGHRRNYRVSKLSGGEKQRVAIARAIASAAPIMACDEITGNLDSATSKEIISLLKEVSKDRLVLMVTHDPEEAMRYATRSIRLYDGEIVENKELSKVDVISFTPPVIKTPKMKDIAKVSWEMLFRSPVKLIFTTIFLLLAVMVIGFAVNLIDSDLELDSVYYNTQFRNSFEERVVVKKKNFAPFTEDEIKAFDLMKGVNYSCGNDFALDADSMFLNTTSDYRFWVSTKVMSSKKLTKRDLFSGRLPENQDEICVQISSDDDAILGEYLTVQLASIRVDLKVVGIVPKNKFYTENSIVFVTDTLFDRVSDATYLYASVFEISALSQGLEYNDVQILTNSPYDIVIENHGKLRADNYLTNVTFKSGYSSVDFKNIKVSVVNVDYDSNEYYRGGSVIKVSQWIYDRISLSDDVFQVSLDVDLASQESVIKVLETHPDYIVYQVSRGMEQGINIGEIILNVFVKVLSSFIFVFVYVIGYFTLRNVMTTKRGDLQVVRSLGANNKWIKRHLFIELLTIMHFAVVGLIAIVLIMKQLRTYSFWAFLQTMTIASGLIVYVVALVLVVLLAHGYYNRLFKLSIVSKEVE